MKQLLASLLGTVIALNAGSAFAAADLKALEAAARGEGQVNSVGMPDSWANWKGTWSDLASKYAIQHSDTDMSSAQEIAKFLAEKGGATADIGDVGASFGPIAVQKGVNTRCRSATSARPRRR
jgi:putative spermidine/putrescine transport system substrate-binding protein